MTNVRLVATREGGITMPPVTFPAAGAASPPGVPVGKLQPGKAQLKRLPHVGVNGATAAPAAQSQPGRPQLKRLQHVGANGGDATVKGKDGTDAGSNDGFAAALFAAGGPLATA